MNDKYSLDELKRFLLEPSFDDEIKISIRNDILVVSKKEIIKLLKLAIDHHNELEKFENRRGI